MQGKNLLLIIVVLFGAIIGYKVVLRSIHLFRYSMEGRAFVARGELEKALESFSKALEISPNFDLVLEQRGKVYYDLKQYPQAIEDLERAIQQKPSYSRLYNCALAYMFMEKDEAAINYFTKALFFQDQGELYYNRGLLYFKKGEYDNAIIDFSKAVELSPEFADAYNNLGLVYLKNDDWENALVNLSKAIERDPANGKFLKNRASLLYKLGENQKADEDVQRARALGYNVSLNVDLEVVP